MALDWPTIIVSVFGSGTVGGLTATYAKGGVDKRAAQREHRRNVLDGAHLLVHQGQAVERKILLVDPRYLALRPYLSEAAERELRGQGIKLVADHYGTVGNPYLGVIRDEADRLEKEWKV
jgi:hypothetical protein